ncbi:MAG: HAD-IIIA family hydrolase [Phycisphaeraceae bacterium]|nr:HAD-IIIA family hydrolase [Phycisphaeraceae bacterium]MCW5754778.1 HAD-IIIA family hydrolase [Phycisphaeraceae bacterium]
MRAAVFLDRDDTLIASRAIDWLPDERPGDLADPSRVQLLPGVLDGCRMLAEAGLPLVVVSNQGAVARGGATLEQVEAVNDRMRDLLIDELGRSLLAGVYYCPFHPQGDLTRFTREHPWRKPHPGMILAACMELAIDPSQSFLIGDAPRDIDSGRAAGLSPEQCLLLGHDAPDFFAAALSILGRRAAGVGRPSNVATARLLALRGEPLADQRTRETVLASARALAERTGVCLLGLRAEPSAIEVTLRASPVAALGFVAELRRITNRWHEARHGGALWPEDGAW